VSTTARAASLTSTRSFPLWYGVLGPPILWAIQLVLGDGLYEFGCAKGFVRTDLFGLSFRFWQVAGTALILTLDVLAGVLASRVLRQLRRTNDGTAHGRAMAMAVIGVVSACLYGLLIAYAFLPPFILRACSHSP
jgi:hypothetical protein